jgi:GNAT superfamily N-acetyltransferase
MLVAMVSVRVVVRAVAPEVTFPLRQAVLRPHQQVAELAEHDDSAPGARAFAAFDPAGRVVGTGVVSRRPPGWQVRAMAVDPSCRGQGIGSEILAAILAHVRSAGGGLVWCNARTPAVALYERAGFVAVGTPFDLPHIGPHLRLELEVEVEGGAGGGG